MDDIAQALIEVAEMLADGGSKTAAGRPWSPNTMKQWIKSVKAPVNAIGHEWKKVSSALKQAERSIDDRRVAYNELTDARDALDNIEEYHKMASGKILGALSYVDMAEE